jgi:superfamily I DNA/RNA helicase
MSTAEHRAIIGGPGSGKTQILLHRARHLCDAHGIHPDRFRIFVYTNVLKDYIRTALRDLRLPEENVLTVDQWCNLYYREKIGGKLPWDAAAKRPDFDEIRRAVFAKAAAGPPLFDFVMIDEGQDLTEEVFEFLGKVSKHVTVCLDNKQQIYDTGSTEQEILACLGIRRSNVSLIEAFRVCPYVVEVASQLIPDAAEREAFMNQTRQPQTERQTPLIYFAKDFDDDREMLYNMVRERQLKNEKIAILLPTNRYVYGCANGLLAAGIDIEVPPKGFGKQSIPAHDFSSPRPKLMSYHSAKGLTFDSVFMPGLVTSLFARTGADRLQKLLFVAITRATKWCYFSTMADNPFGLLRNKIMPLAESRKVSLLRAGEGVATPSGPPPSPPSPPSGYGEDLDFL